MKTNRQIDIMGIVNITDDSYFAESRCPDIDSVLRRIGMMVDEGVDIVDIGPCSSRPGSVPIGPDAEWERLAPVLPAVREAFPYLRISIDTYCSSVVEKAYDSIGGFIVNDISAGDDDPLMLPLVGRLGLGYVAMHKRGDQEIIPYFKAFAHKAEESGIKNWILDPGFGFAKTVEQNYEVLNQLELIRNTFRPHRLLVGVSRKSMIYKPLGITPEDALPATQAVHMAALMAGADILRVHDVKEAKQTVDLYHMLIR